MGSAKSFPALSRSNARALILGSMPGAESLRRQQYYAHPANQFWPIMGELFGAGREIPYKRRVAKLLGHGVAVWDVLKQCEREGSLDSAILRDSEVVNDFARFFERHPKVRAVFFNGSKAESVFLREVRDRLGVLDRQIRYTRLPSTSPAHASLSRTAKLDAWRSIAESL
jgi:double-stranded uracil-DNA glycosylase